MSAREAAGGEQHAAGCERARPELVGEQPETGPAASMPTVSGIM